MAFSHRSLIHLVLAASAMGFGYVAWNIGILHGHVTILAGASYFIPVLSAALAALLLSSTVLARRGHDVPRLDPVLAGHAFGQGES